ncbi:MAG: hypothetical protein ABFS17_13330 [Chloroflexota bacterium]
MNKTQFFELLAENQNPLIFDGAMGTMLHSHVVSSGDQLTKD